MKAHVHPNQVPLPFNGAQVPASMPVPDYAMWVGGKFYPSVQDYIDEAIAVGCSKRLPTIPDDLVIGESRVYLAHAGQAEHIAEDPILRDLKPAWRARMFALARKVRDGLLTRQQAIGQAPKKLTEVEAVFDSALAFVKEDTSVIFGYFVVTRLEFIVPPDGNVPEKVKELAAKGHIKLVPWKVASAEPDRGCGRRRAGGMYVTAYVDDEGVQALRKDAKDVDIHGPLAVFHKPFRAPFGFFRGIKRLEGRELAATGVAAALVGTKED